jgi:hypothetical protein
MRDGVGLSSVMALIAVLGCALVMGHAWVRITVYSGRRESQSWRADVVTTLTTIFAVFVLPSILIKIAPFEWIPAVRGAIGRQAIFPMLFIFLARRKLNPTLSAITFSA